MHITEAELKKRDDLRFKGIRLGRPLIGPEIVQLHINNYCNLSCQYCLYHSSLNPSESLSPKNMSLSRFRSIIRDCVEMKVDRVYISGQGEPTLHPRFYDMLSMLRSLPFSVGVLSNGTFPLRRCPELVQTDWIRINLGAVDRAGYRAIHGRDLFDRVTANIREMVRIRKDLNPDFRIETAFILNRLNAPVEGKMKALVRSLGVDYTETVFPFLNQHARCISVANHPGQQRLAGQHWVPCFNGWYFALLRLDNTMTMCCQIKPMVIADITKASFKEAWLSDEYARVRNMALLGKFRKEGDCRDCREWRKNRGIALKLAALRKL